MPKGGTRAGSGRPALPQEQKKVFKTVSISGKPEQIEKLKKLAKARNLTVSKMIISDYIKD